MMKIKHVYFFLIFFCSFRGFTQDILPFVENFSKANYNGDNQVWSVTQGNDDAMYFANNRFLLRYNGVTWEKYTLPNKTIIRAVFSDEDKIYTGSYNELGYWIRVAGKMVYYSLSKEKNLFKGKLINEEIWKIFKFKDKIYFQSFNELFVFDGKTIKNLNIPYQISYCFIVEDILYVATVNKGVFILNNEKFIPQSNWKDLENKIIHSIEKQNNITYFFTRKNGVYISENTILKPWDNNPLNDLLKNEIINTARFIDKNRLAIGTAFKGIYIVNLTDYSFININRNNSFLNNSVLSIGFDKENDLWLGMDNGISHIEINSPYSIFSDNTGILGSVYSVSKTNDGYLLGTNHGVFNYENKEIEFIKGSQGQVWQIDKINNKYIIGHNEGTFCYESNKIEKINHINGGWKLLKNNNSPHYFQANYSGIVVYENDDFKKYKRIEGLTKPIKNIAQNKNNELWAVDNYKSLYRIEFDTAFRATKIDNITQLNGIENDYNVKLFTFKNEMLFYIDNNWYKFNAITNKLEDSQLFNSKFKNISDIIPIDDSKFLVIQSGVFYLIEYNNNNFYWKLLPKKYYQGKIINEDTKVIKFEDKLIINLDDGFFSYTLGKLDEVDYTITVEGFYKDELITEKTKIKFNQSIELQVIVPFYGYNKKNLFYKINGNQEFLPIIDGTILLNNLNSGQQQVDIYSLKEDNYKKIKSYSFTILKPWYFSFWMIVVYLLVVSGALFLYYKWNKIRYIEKIKLKEEELRHQKQILQLEMDAENRLKMQEYEKHILEIQVQTKASEVAGKSLSIAKQTEMIESIQNILDSESNINVVKSQISKVIKINSLNKNEWKSFENNLLKSNEDFVQILTSRFTNLTAKDIKLCIYLKMNLSSKEIAPLLNISYRGVELHRYRLRKKLKLDTTVNLNLFMNNLK